MLEHGLHIVSWRPTQLLDLLAGEAQFGHRGVAHAFLQFDNWLDVGIECLAQEVSHVDDGDVGRFIRYIVCLAIFTF